MDVSSRFNLLEEQSMSSSGMFSDGASQQPEQSQTPAKKTSSWVGGLLIGLVLIGAVFGYKYWNKSSTSDEVKQDVLKAFSAFEDQKLIRSLVDKHHDECFDACYTMGGRRRSAKFDSDQYIQMMSQRIRTDLLAQGFALDTN
jgi:hypothetical protein